MKTKEYLTKPEYWNMFKGLKSPPKLKEKYKVEKINGKYKIKKIKTNDQQNPYIKMKKEITNKELLSWCFRCHREFEEMGEVLKWGKHYPACRVKHIDGTEELLAESMEIVEAICKECMVDVNSKNFDKVMHREDWQKQLDSLTPNIKYEERRIKNLYRTIT